MERNTTATTRPALTAGDDGWAPPGVRVTGHRRASRSLVSGHLDAKAAGLTAASGYYGPVPAGPVARWMDRREQTRREGRPTRTETPAPAGVIEPAAVVVEPAAVVVEPVGRPVDAAPRAVPAARVGREVIPSQLRDGAYLATAARESTTRAAHSLAYHLVRLPLYWARLALRSPIGAARLLVVWLAWVSDHDGRAVRRQLAIADAVGTAEAGAFARVETQHRETMKHRAAASGLAVALVLVLVLLVWLRSPELLPLLGIIAGASVPAVLGWHGRSERTVIASRATADAATPAFTSDLVVGALESLGIAELNKAQRTGAGEGIRFVSPIHRDGPGWRADIDLPPGVTATDVIERRDRLASGLRRPEGCVWPEVDPDAHAGRLVLWVGDRVLSSGAPVPWPLAVAGRVNLFETVPVGTDQRGRARSVTLMYASAVIGAIPRMGKTFALRLLLLAAALDPRSELHVHNLKGGSDLEPLAAVAHYYRSGDEPEDVDALMADLRAVHEDMRRRYKVLRDLPREVCPESKVTDELASRRELGLHPVVVALDECQVIFEHPTYKGEATELVTDLVKRGPAVAVMVLVATQRPDRDSLPSGIRANAVLRLCLKVTEQVANDMVLGTSAYRSGVRATMFSRRDLGVAYLAGEGDDPVIVRTAYVDSPAAASVAARARAARVAAGTLTGMAAGEVPADDDSRSIVDHLADVWPAGVERCWWDELAAALAARMPATYGELTGEAVSAAARSHGLPSVQVARTIDGERVNKRGTTRAALLDAVSSRTAA